MQLRSLKLQKLNDFLKNSWVSVLCTENEEDDSNSIIYFGSLRS